MPVSYEEAVYELFYKAVIPEVFSRESIVFNMFWIPRSGLPAGRPGDDNFLIYTQTPYGNSMHGGIVRGHVF